MDLLENVLKQRPVAYITRDIERALGLPLNTEGYFVVSNFSKYGESIAENQKNVELVKAEKILDTWELLEKVYGLRSTVYGLVVFKNTPRIERICREQNITLLNPSAELSNRIEEKISQVEWLGDLKKYLPEHEITTCKEAEFKDEPFILQFNRAHTGSGTQLISTQEQLEEIKQKFPDRPARITKYVNGPIFTVNCLVAKSKILVGNISYQITGLKPFTDQEFATIGNDWGVVKNILSEEQIEKIKSMAVEIGKKMQSEGWKGLFGIDVVVADDVYLIEINARQPASAVFESQLQTNIRITNDSNVRISIFEAHLGALLDLDLENYELIEIKDGAQIVLRNQDSKFEIQDSKLKKEGFNLIRYDNTKIGSDLLRIQSKKTIMNAHNKFNDLGNKILNLIT